MNEYTPTTAKIRRRATEPRYEKYDRRKALVRLLEGEFDRWLAEVQREVAEKAWDEGYSRGNAHNGRRDDCPYRADRDA